jgi:hypothetical protein
MLEAWCSVIQIHPRRRTILTVSGEPYRILLSIDDESGGEFWDCIEGALLNKMKRAKQNEENKSKSKKKERKVSGPGLLKVVQLCDGRIY